MNEQAPSRAGLRPSAPLLQLNALTKSYGSTRASRQVSFDVGLGEIVALVGENGAGKSTLMGMMSGVVAPDSGEIRLDGKAVHLSSPGAAQAHGIATVFQELSLSPNLTVMENMFAGRPPTRFGLIDRSRLRADTDAVLQRFGLPIDPDALIGDLPVSSRQIVEIAKAVSRGARVLLLDEPTSALNAGEKQALFKVIETLRALGTGIIYISHHLDEVIALADRIVVLRDGAVVSITQKGEATPASLVRDMVGRDIETSADLARPAEGSAILSVSGVSHGTAVHDVSFSMRPGEIIALAGLMGAGRSELAHMVVGLSKPSTGSVTLLGKPVRSGGMRTARVDGIGYVPAERKSEGLFLDLPVSANIAATSLSRQSRAGVVVEKRIQGLAQKHIDRLSIKVDDSDPPVRSLSGGNQQKVLLAKWLEIEPRLLVLEEPTKGVDIGAKFDIHREIKQLAAVGAAVLVVSSDLPEILALSHRVLVMHQGRLVADLDARVTSEQQIVAYASGLQEVTHAVQ